MARELEEGAEEEEEVSESEDIKRRFCLRYQNKKQKQAKAKRRYCKAKRRYCMVSASNRLRLITRQRRIVLSFYLFYTVCTLMRFSPLL